MFPIGPRSVREAYKPILQVYNAAQYFKYMYLKIRRLFNIHRCIVHFLFEIQHYVLYLYLKYIRSNSVFSNVFEILFESILHSTAGERSMPSIYDCR